MDEPCCSALAPKRRTAANDNDRKTIAEPAGIRTGCGSSRPARRRHDHENSPQQGVYVFIVERRGFPSFEPLMEWIGDDDPLVTVELSFPTLAAAILCANRQRLSVRRADHPRAGTAKMKQAFWDETFGWLGLGALQDSYGKAVPVRFVRTDRHGEKGWTSPMAAVRMGAWMAKPDGLAWIEY